MFVIQRRFRQTATVTAEQAPRLETDPFARGPAQQVDRQIAVDEHVFRKVERRADAVPGIGGDRHAHERARRLAASDWRRDQECDEECDDRRSWGHGGTHVGAPLGIDELDELIHNYENVKPYLTEAGIKSIEKNGKYLYDKEFGWVNPTIKGEMCAYGFRDNKGILKCAIEQAYNDGKLSWKKPISCHLFPIRVKKSKQDPDLEYVNYEPREDLCKAACKLGQKLKVPVYLFLKESITRKYGEEFYAALDQIAKDYFEVNNKA